MISMRCGMRCSAWRATACGPRRPGGRSCCYTLVTTHITIASVTIFLHRAQAHRALELHRDPVALLPLLAVADHRHGDQGVGGDPPQAPRQVRDRRRSAQPADTRHPQPCCCTAPSSIAPKPKNHETTGQVRPRHARRLDRAQPVQPLQLCRAWALMLIIDLAAVRRHRLPRSGRCRCCGSRSPPPASSTASATGGATAISRRPTPSTNVVAVGRDHRWRRAAQQPPHLPDLGQAVGQAVRVRHRLGLHPHPAGAGPGHGAQDAAAAGARRRRAGASRFARRWRR